MRSPSAIFSSSVHSAVVVAASFAAPPVPLHEAVQGARAVVLPSEWYENAPMSVLEAYALGKPVLGARIGGIPELVRHGETGLLFESGSVQSLTDALAEIQRLGDAELSAMGHAGRRCVETEFTADIYRERILNVYRELGVREPNAAGHVGRVS